MMTLNENVISQYPDGSKCAEFIADLVKADLMTWEAIYWRAKYLYTYGRDLCTSQVLIGYFNECFNQGLSVNANQALYMDARKMQSALYIAEEDFKMASNCIQAVLDITEDIPAEMFLDLTYAEIHTDLERILKSPTLFFNDLHTADTVAELRDRQKSIVCRLLLKAAEAKSKSADIVIDVASIEREVNGFGLTASEEYILFKKVLAGEAAPVIIPASVPKPAVKKPVEVKKPVPETKPKEEKTKKRDADGLLIIDLFGDEKEPETQAKAAEPKADEIPAKVVSVTPDMSGIEAMLSSIMGMVKANAEQIAALQGQLGETKDVSETAKIEAELQEGKAKNQELLQQLEAAQAQLALSEEQKQALRKTIDEQASIIDIQRSSQFTEENLVAFSNFNCVVMLDTCSIEHQLDLLDYIQPNEMVRISQTVIDELEHHKKSGDIERQMMGQRALKAIRSKKCSAAFDFEHAYPQLLPKAYQIKDDDNIGTKNDKYIFSAALRYKAHTSLKVILISDDVTMQAMAMSEHIETMTAAEFIAGKEKYVPVAPALTEEEYLAKKLRAKDFSLTMNEILVLQGYKVVTYGDFINTPEDAISFMKAKNGINLGNRLLLVHNKIKADYESKFPKASITNEDSDLF